MAKHLVPKWDRVLVDPLSRELESCGIVLPESSVEEQKLGIVMMVGPKCKDTRVGELVVFGVYAGIEIEIGGKLFVCLKEEEILGAVEDTDV